MAATAPSISPLQQSGLPSRDKSLSKGLIPVDITQLDADLSCAICRADFTDPVVKLGCHDTHVYCRDCIIPWLQFTDFCPLCHTKVLRKIPRKEALVNQAQETIIDRWSDFEAFGAGPFYEKAVHHHSVQYAFTRAAWFLIEGRPSEGMATFNDRIITLAGTGFVNTAALAPQFAMMGNYILAIGEAQGQPWTDRQQQHWKLLLTTLWRMFTEQAGRSVMDTNPKRLFDMLRAEARLTSDVDVDEIQFFRLGQPALGALKMFLDFVVCVLITEELDRLSQIQKRKEWYEKKSPWLAGLLTRVGFL